MPLMCAYCRRIFNNEKIKQCPFCESTVFKRLKQKTNYLHLL